MMIARYVYWPDQSDNDSLQEQLSLLPTDWQVLLFNYFWIFVSLEILPLYFMRVRPDNKIPSAKVQQSDWRQGVECE